MWPQGFRGSELAANATAGPFVVTADHISSFAAVPFPAAHVGRGTAETTTTRLPALWPHSNGGGSGSNGHGRVDADMGVLFGRRPSSIVDASFAPMQPPPPAVGTARGAFAARRSFSDGTSCLLGEGEGA